MAIHAVCNSRKKKTKPVLFQYITPLLFAAALGSPVWAQSVEIDEYVGVEITAEDIEAGEDALFQAALQGFNGTLAELGRAMVRGDVIEQDVEAGVQWLEVAAAQDSVPALFSLGDLFAQGEFVERDQARAFDAYDRAAALDQPSAYLRIGRMFEIGRGGTPDPDRALAAYDEAVLLEVPGANLALARGHLDGRFGELSEPELALEIFEQSDEATMLELRPYIGDAILRGKGVAQDIDTGLALLNESAAAGAVRALLFLGAAYADGAALEPDADKSLQAYETAIELGETGAYFRMARLFEEGGLLANQPERAIELYAAATTAGLAEDADFALARGHLKGRFGDLSQPAEGFAIYQRLLAAENDNVDQLHRDVGELLLTGGEGVDQDATAGLEKIALACDLGQAWSCERMGRLSATGQYSERDGDRALGYYEQAVDLGLPVAHLSMGRLYEGGSAVQADPEKAIAAYQAAFDEGLVEDAEFALARGHIRKRFGALSNPSNALETYKRYVAEGNTSVHSALGRDIGEALFTGGDLEQDIEGGLQAIRAAAEAGSGWAWLSYGRKFTTGEIVDVDQARALEAYEAALSLGLDAAHFNIGRLYEDFGVPGLTPDPERALSAYQAARDAGQSTRANLSMARGHMSGRFGALSDAGEARALYDDLIENGSVEAMVELGRELVRGERLTADSEAGLNLFEAAAVEGNERAKREILNAFIRNTTPRTRATYLAVLDENDVESTLPIDAFTRVIATGQRIDYATAWEEYLKLDPALREATARVSSTSNRRLFVSFLQGALNARGIDAGPVDGILGRRTVNGYRTFCLENFDANFCNRGPLHRDAREPLTEYISTAEVAEG